ncbi:TPA: hypothetical protein HNC92_28855 [Escherichia coli]|nr:hypothetical protein [Escherichia coli]HAJ6775305.1 hypothetical protein [Escherichia coli]
MDSNNAIKVMLSHMLDESFKTNEAVNAIVMKLMIIMAANKYCTMFLLYLVAPQFFLCNLHQH